MKQMDDLIKGEGRYEVKNRSKRIIECVMIGATGGQGISFVSPGQQIKE